MSAPILSTHGLTKRFGGLLASDFLDFDVITGEVHAVIGPNGAGKTTLINQLIGELVPDGGRIEFEGRDITTLPSYRRSLLGLSRSYQITSVFPDFTALENVSLAAQAHDGHSFGLWRPVSREERLTRPARAALEEVGLSTKNHTYAAELAHGEHRQLELAMALVSRPKVLLLDEPMAGMGRLESESMIKLLASLKRRYSIVLVEHDMDVVFALADRISVLVYGKTIACGSPSAIRASIEVKRAYLGERYASG